MSGNHQKPAKGVFLLFACLINIIVLRSGYVTGKGYWLLIISLPLLAIAILYMTRSRS